MIALTAIALGLATAPMRSVVSMVVVGFLVCVAYVAAVLTAPAAASVLSFALALVSYNFSLLAGLFGIHVLERARARARFV